MKYFSISLFVIFLASACQEKEKPATWGTDFSKTHLKYAQSAAFSLNTQREEDKMGIYKIWYIGAIQDTLLIPSQTDTGETDLIKMIEKYNRKNLKMFYKSYDPEPDNPDNPLVFVDDNGTSDIADSSDVEIFIDTSRAVGFIYKNYLFEKQSGGNANFPVFIKNISKDTLRIGEGGSSDIFSRLIMEAKNKSGEWKPIEQYLFFSCGTGIKEYFILPNHIAITGAKIYKGKIKTELRLTMGKVHSNSFIGYLDKS
jgi:hypothetical protein